MRAGEHRRGGGVSDRQDTRPVEAGRGDASKDVGGEAAIPGRWRGRIDHHPGRDVLEAMGWILDRRIVDADAEPAGDRGQRVAVLGLLGLREDHEPAPCMDKGLDGVDLGGSIDRRTLTRRRLPLVGRAVRHDEDIGAGQHIGREWASGMHGHCEAVVMQRAGRLDQAAIRRIARPHSGRDLGPRRPGLAVGLVEKDAGNDAHEPCPPIPESRRRVWHGISSARREVATPKADARPSG